MTMGVYFQELEDGRQTEVTDTFKLFCEVLIYGLKFERDFEDTYLSIP